LEDFDAGEFFIMPYLKRERINRLNTVVVSHSDNDHIGGIPSILRNLPVDRVFDNGLFNESSICSTYQVIIESFGIDYQVAQAGYQLTELENCGIYFLHPGKAFVSQFKDDINNCSVVVKIIYGDRSFLFTGDIGSEAENVMLSYGELLKADVLKVAHHGSRTSSTEEWLKFVQPEFAVISVGKNNRFNFPAPSVLKRFDQVGIKTIRTDLNGAVVFRTDGKQLEMIR
jgi:competence protein ComEC